MSEKPRPAWRSYMPDDVRDALERFQKEQDPPWSDRQVITTALRLYFQALGYLELEERGEPEAAQPEKESDGGIGHIKAKAVAESLFRN